MRWSTSFYQKNIPCLLAWELLCGWDPGVPLAQPHPLFASFPVIFDLSNYKQILSNLTKTNIIVRFGTKWNEKIRAVSNHPPPAAMRLFGLYLVIFWKFFGNFLPPAAKRFIWPVSSNFLGFFQFFIICQSPPRMLRECLAPKRG